MPLELVAADCAYTLEGDVIKVALPKEKHLLCVSNEYYVLVLSVPKTKADSSSGCCGIGAGAGVLLLALPLICARLRKRGTRSRSHNSEMRYTRAAPRPV